MPRGNRGSTPESLSRRRVVAALASAGVGGLAGCTEGGGGGDGGGSPSPTEGEQTTRATTTEPPESTKLELSGWAANNAESKLLSQLVRSFEKKHPNVTVEYNAIQSKYKQKIKTQLGAGNAPDVFYVDAKFFGSFASAGVLLPLDGLATAKGYNLDGFYDPLLDAFRYDGTLYGIPKDFSTLGLFYNSAMFEKASVTAPKTWADLRSALQAVDENVDVQAPMVEYPNGRMWKGLIFQKGGQIVSDDGSKAVFASDAGVEALQFLVDLRKDGLLAVPSELGSGWHGAALGNEEVATAVLGPWGIPYWSNKFPKLAEKIRVASHVPTPKGGTKATAAYTVSYSASANTNAKTAARTLIKGLTDKGSMKQWARAGLALTSRKTLADLEYYNNHPRRRKLLEAGEWSHPVAYGPKTADIINRLHPQIEAAMLLKKSPRKALEAAQQKINSEVLTG